MNHNILDSYSNEINEILALSHIWLILKSQNDCEV